MCGGGGGSGSSTDYTCFVSVTWTGSNYVLRGSTEFKDVQNTNFRTDGNKIYNKSSYKNVLVSLYHRGRSRLPSERILFKFKEFEP